jgi:hypothetical protein
MRPTTNGNQFSYPYNLPIAIQTGGEINVFNGLTKAK